MIIGKFTFACNGAGTYVYAFAQNQMVCTSVSDELGVRCCSDVPLEGYEQLEGCSIWSAASFAVLDNALVGAATAQQAADICHAEGARRCTAQDFSNKCVTGRTTELVWTGTECVFYSTECASGGCPSNWFLDNVCDDACNSALCSFDGGDCDNALAPKSGVCVPQCQANALASEAMCDAESGCSWTARCVVQEHSCFSKTPKECGASPGCRYRYGSCIESDPGLCDAWSDEAACNAQFDSAGCTWISECLTEVNGTEADCGSADGAAACAEVPGCAWDSAVSDLCPALTRCPDETRQDRVFGSEDDSILTDCACKEGYYDSSRLQIHCWDYARKSSPEYDVLNKDSVQDRNVKDEHDGVGYWKSSCIRCPECVDCSAGGNLTSLKIKATFGLVAQSVLVADESSSTAASTTTLDVFKCPLAEACLEVTLEQVLAGNPRACAAGFDSAPTTPLCAGCVSGYMINRKKCIECGSLGSSYALLSVLIVLIVAAIATTVAMKSYQKHSDSVKLMLSMVRLTWPRMLQSMKLLVSNYQILGALPSRLGVKFPSAITSFLNYAGV